LGRKLDSLYQLQLKLALEGLEAALDQLGAPMHMFMDGLCALFQHVDMENSYLCGYLKIKGLTEVSVNCKAARKGAV